MLRSLLWVAAVVAVVAGAGLAFAAGVGPLPGDADGATDAEFPTATPTPTVDGGGGTGDDATTTPAGDRTATPVERPFAMRIDRIEECGSTCRDVTVTLTNRQSEPATGTTVYTRVFAGNSTDEDDLVWRGSEDVGRLDAGGDYTATKRVELSYSEAYAVEQADGWVTIQTTIRTDDRTVTFTRRRDVN